MFWIKKNTTRRKNFFVAVEAKLLVPTENM